MVSDAILFRPADSIGLVGAIDPATGSAAV
jgi:hypothetical protein